MSNSNVIARMRKLHAENGGILTPDIVVQDASDETSPLHTYFEWDDAEAAVKWRRAQARDLIRSIRVEVEYEDVHIKTIGYIQDPDKDTNVQGYVPVAILRSDKDRARRALEQELNRAESAMHRAYDVAHALGLSGEVELLLTQIRGIRTAA